MLLTLFARIHSPLCLGLGLSLAFASSEASAQNQLFPPREVSLLPSGTEANAGAEWDPYSYLLLGGSDWIRWWTLNRDPILAERLTPGAGSVGAMPLLGERAAGSLAGLDLDAVHWDVVPLLQERLDKTRDMDLRIACLLALGKIGEAPRSLKSREGVEVVSVETSIRARLADPNKQVRAAALIALGLVGGPRASALLGEIADGSKEGKRALGGAPGRRTRAFAIYGLGLAGHHTRRLSERTAIVARLLELAEEEASVGDLGVAAVLGLAWAPLPLAAPAAGEESDAHGQANTVRRLLRLYDRRETSSEVRAHLPVVMARLMTTDVDQGSGAPAKGAAVQIAALREELRMEVITRLTEDLGKRGAEKKVHVREGSLVALGLLVKPASEGLDQRALELVQKASKNSKSQQNGVAQLALARVAARASDDTASQAAAKEVIDGLISLLETGGAAQRNWVSLALGFYEHEVLASGGPPTLSTREALRERFRSAKTPSATAAASLGLGLAGDDTMEAEVIDAMTDGEVMARALYPAALALMGSQEAAAALRETIPTKERTPVFLREAAQGLAMLKDPGLLELLSEELEEAKGAEDRVTILRGLALSHDAGALPVLLRVLGEKRFGSQRVDDRSRAFAASALGILCSKHALPWNAHMGLDVLYGAASSTLTDLFDGGGVLDYL